MDHAQKEKLVEALLRCEAISNHHNRDTVVRQLPEEIRHSIKHGQTDRVHIVNILDACLQHLQGLQHLCNAVGLCEGQTPAILEVLSLVRGISSGESTRRRTNRQALAQARQHSVMAANGTSPYKIDWDIIIRYDLREQVSCFEQSLRTTGVFAFALGGDVHLLREYILKRFERIIERDNRYIKRLHVSLYGHDVQSTITGSQFLRQAIKTQHPNTLFTELFDERRVDVLLFIWNYTIPLPEIRQIATSFWEDITAQLLPHIHRRLQRLIIFLINVGQQPVDAFMTIPLLQQFEIEDTKNYFYEQLILANVDEETIHSCLIRLHTHGGNLHGTYHEMRRIFEDLSGGRAQ